MSNNTISRSRIQQKIYLRSCVQSSATRMRCNWKIIILTNLLKMTNQKISFPNIISNRDIKLWSAVVYMRRTWLNHGSFALLPIAFNHAIGMKCFHSNCAESSNCFDCCLSQKLLKLRNDEQFQSACTKITRYQSKINHIEVWVIMPLADPANDPAIAGFKPPDAHANFEI